MLDLRRSIPAFAFLALAACGPPAPAPGVTVAWRTEGLESPESVLPAPDGGYFVSNVAGEPSGRDGVGYITRLDPMGEIVTRQWAAGLDAPKGMAIAGARLFVSDIDRLVEIDLATGAIIARHPSPDAAFLNDVAVAPDGAVLVSDTDGARILALTPDGLAPWLADARLEGINGLFAAPDGLIVASRDHLWRVDWSAKTINAIVSGGLGSADGVAALPDGGWAVSDWKGRLFRVAPDGALTVLLDSRREGRTLNDLTLAPDGAIVIANWAPGEVTAYRRAP